MRVFGIYGYGFISPCRVGAFELVPLHLTREALGKGYKDPLVFRLTGYGVCPASVEPNEHDDIKRLGDMLSFCQQQWVVTSHAVRCETADVKEHLPAEFDITQKRESYGDALQADWEHGTSRVEFLEVLSAKLTDDAFVKRTGFDKGSIGAWRC